MTQVEQTAADRRAADRTLAIHPAVGSEPRRPILGVFKVHRDRLKFRRLPLEAKVWVQSLRHHDTPKPFVIYGRPRSGTTLLVRLLNQVPAIRCDEELLHFFLLNPTGFVRRLPRRAGSEFDAYGFKLISYHLMDIQRIRRPLAFFDHIDHHGYSVLHLTRNTWDQTLSLAKAQYSGVYFSDQSTGAQVLRLDPDRFVDLLRWNERMLDYERKVMAHVDHVSVHYNDDLQDAALHQETIDRLCSSLGVASGEVSAPIRRTGGAHGLQKVENMHEVAARVQDSDLAHLIPEKLRT